MLVMPTGAGKSKLARRIYELKKARRQVEGAFVVRARELRQKRNGEDFLKLTVADRSGTVEAVAWESVADCFVKRRSADGIAEWNPMGFS